MSRKSLFALLKITVGALLLLNGFALVVFLGLHQKFPAALEWAWGTISYTVIFALCRGLLMIVVGICLIWIGRHDLRELKNQKPKR